MMDRKKTCLSGPGAAEIALGCLRYQDLPEETQCRWRTITDVSQDSGIFVHTEQQDSILQALVDTSYPSSDWPWFGTCRNSCLGIQKHLQNSGVAVATPARSVADDPQDLRGLGKNMRLLKAPARASKEWSRSRLSDRPVGENKNRRTDLHMDGLLQTNSWTRKSTNGLNFVGLPMSHELQYKETCLELLQPSHHSPLLQQEEGAGGRTTRTGIVQSLGRRPRDPLSRETSWETSRVRCRPKWTRGRARFNIHRPESNDEVSFHCCERCSHSRTLPGEVGGALISCSVCDGSSW